MLKRISKLPKIILFCFDKVKESLFLGVFDLDFFLFFAIQSVSSMGLKYKFTPEARRNNNLKNFRKINY